VTLLLALLLAVEPAASHQVSIPLADYDQLRQLSERPALTVVDLLRVEGSFANRDLAIAFEGRASGSWPTAEVLSAQGLRLHSCQGGALLSRAASGAFAVTPLAQRFTLRCKASLDGSDRLAAQATAAVLEVVSSVSDGELVAAGTGPERAFSVVRRLAGAEQQDLPPTVTGRYLVTLLPDEARFAYRLEVRNPARGHRRFEIALRQAEHVEGVDAPVAWDAEGARYRFDLPPGDTALTLRGRLTEARFAPPVAASLQYLLLESHPLIRPDLATQAKRVGVGETGLPARFRGAQAFLLDGGAGAPGAEVAWKATRLEALKTAGLALHRLSQVFFLGADGVARGESNLAIDNQGAPALTLRGASRPTFASVGGEPAFLTHDADGNLFLPLAQGPQEVVIQDAQDFGRRLGFAVARLDLPRPGVPASRAAIQLRYPAEWIPLYEELAPQARLHLLDLGEGIALLALAALLERLLALGGVARRRRWAVALSLASAGAFLPGLRAVALALLAVAWVGLGAALIVQRLRGALRVLALGAGLGAALLSIAVVGALLGAERSFGPSGLDSADLAYERGAPIPAKTLASSAPLQKAAAGEAALASGGPSYEGLPARIEIPPGARQTGFNRELLATDAPRSVLAVLVAARVVAALAGAAALLFLAVAFTFRRDLAACARVLAARALGSATPVGFGA
jgi:hypothetical protein